MGHVSLMDELHAITGFPSQREEHRQPGLNLHTLLAPRLRNTFFAGFIGDAMTGAKIIDGDLLIIERLSDYNHGSVVLAIADGRRLVRCLEKREGRLFLRPANRNYREIEVGEEVELFGSVVHSVTHHLRINQHLPAVC